MINTINYKGKTYPAFQSSHFAARFAFAYAKDVCKGNGFDIGTGDELWKLPGAIAIDPKIDDRFHAMQLPPSPPVDFIFSSHCLEHLPDWVGVLNYWTDRMEIGGTLFLYLPDFSQEYWKPWNNRKHCNTFTPDIIRGYLEGSERYSKIFVSGVDLNNSFMAMGEKIK